MKYNTVKELLKKYHSGTLTDSEKKLLFTILYSPEHHSDLQNFIDEGLTDPMLEELGDQETLELIYQQIQFKKEEAPEKRSYTITTKIKMEICSCSCKRHCFIWSCFAFITTT